LKRLWTAGALACVAHVIAKIAEIAKHSKSNSYFPILHPRSSAVRFWIFPITAIARDVGDLGDPMAVRPTVVESLARYRNIKNHAPNLSRHVP